jgi:hypothetical protein
VVDGMVLAIAAGRNAGIRNSCRRSATELCNGKTQSVQWARFVAKVLSFATVENASRRRFRLLRCALSDVATEQSVRKLSLIVII